jgi:hypothetical protein
MRKMSPLSGWLLWGVSQERETGGFMGFSGCGIWSFGIWEFQLLLETGESAVVFFLFGFALEYIGNCVTALWLLA